MTKIDTQTILTTSLAPAQLTILWHELESAYYEDNSYGGDTAEIYAHTLIPHSVMLGRCGFAGDAGDALGS